MKKKPIRPRKMLNASERAAAIAAIELLTELLDRCSLERREVADYADRAASAGRTCVEAWPKK